MDLSKKTSASFPKLQKPLSLLPLTDVVIKMYPLSKFVF